jgi:hypothetical protein
MKLLTGLTAAALVALVAQGCGGSDSDPEAVGAAGTAGETAAGTGGTAGTDGGDGGTAGTPDAGGDGGTGGETEPDPPATIMCEGTECSNYSDPTLDGFISGGLPACCSGEAGDLCGLNVDAASALFKGLTGCMELNQATEAGDWSCEGMSMDSPVGAIALPACCRGETKTCGVDVSVAALGATLGFPLSEGAEFGCVDPVPFLADADVATLPDFWKDGDVAKTEAPACE